MWYLCNPGFSNMEQGLDERLDDYLHCASELLPKIYHTSDMSRISAKDTNYYAVVYGLNCRKIKDSVVGHWRTQWKMMEECFRDIHNIGAGYKQAKGYCRDIFSLSDASGINEIKTMKKTGPCYKCGGPHFQQDCTNNINNKIQTKISMSATKREAYAWINFTKTKPTIHL